MDLNVRYLFLILCHLKPFKTETLPNNFEVEFNIETEDDPTTFDTKMYLETATDTNKRGQAIRMKDLRLLFQELGSKKRILREENSAEDTSKKEITTTEKQAEGEPVANNIFNNTEDENTAEVTTREEAVTYEESDDMVITVKDLKEAINDLEQKLMERFNRLQSRLASGVENKSSAKVYNLMDLIKIGRGEKLLPHPRTDNLNWLKIKVPFKS